MSTSDLYLLNGKSTRHIAEFRNGWGSAPLAWDHLGHKYVDGFRPYSMDPAMLRKVWALADDPRIQHHEGVVLRMTFDKSFVGIADLADAAECCRKFGKECSGADRVNHWHSIGDALADEAQKRHGRHARGVALSSTSVSDPWLQPDEEWLDGAWSIYADIPAEQTASEAPDSAVS